MFTETKEFVDTLFVALANKSYMEGFPQAPVVVSAANSKPVNSGGLPLQTIDVGNKPADQGKTEGVDRRSPETLRSGRSLREATETAPDYREGPRRRSKSRSKSPRSRSPLRDRSVTSTICIVPKL